jgi:hypothetical protein
MHTLNRAQKITLCAALTALVAALTIGPFLPTSSIAGAATAAATSDTSYDSDSTADPDLPDTPEEIYLTVVRPELPIATDSELLTAGHAVCTTLDQTTAPDASALTGLALGLNNAYGWPIESTGAVIGSAVGSFCPEYGYVIEALDTY